jgi:hypothetical protein
MDLAAVFLLSLLGGYGFASLWRFTSYETRRTDGHHLYFRAAFYGAVFFAAAFMLRVIALAYWPAYEAWDRAAITLVDPALKEPHDARQNSMVVAAAYSMLVGPLFALLLNVFTPKRWSLRRSVNALDDLLLRAQYTDMPVSITLDSGKVYIGLVRRITDPNHRLPSIVLFPMLSGHRDANGYLKLTTNYRRVYDALDADPEMRAKHGLPTVWEPNFEVVLRADQIVSANMFSPSIYSEFNPGWRESIDALPAPPPRQEILVEIKQPPRKPWKR